VKASNGIMNAQTASVKDITLLEQVIQPYEKISKYCPEPNEFIAHRYNLFL